MLFRSMKACEKCGLLNANDCLFCERCGNDLTETWNRKNILWALPMLVLITAFLFFTFRELLPKGEKKDADIQGTISEERKSASTNQQEGELEEESEVDQHERESEDTRQQEETQREETDLSVVINGVDDAYVHTAGTVIQKDGKILLQMCHHSQNHKRKRNILYGESSSDGMEKRQMKNNTNKRKRD